MWSWSFLILAMREDITTVGLRTFGVTQCGMLYSSKVFTIYLTMFSRFCQIKYFFKTAKGKAEFHGQWYLHGSKTILNELSHPQSLYPIAMCEDLSLDSIYQKAHVSFLSQGELENSRTNGTVPTDINDFHCG